MVPEMRSGRPRNQRLQEQGEASVQELQSAKREMDNTHGRRTELLVQDGRPR